MMIHVKGWFTEYMVERCKVDKVFAESKDLANNMIEETLIISYFLRMFELAVMILNTSYLVGLSWIVLCEFIEDIILNEDFTKWKTEEDLIKYAHYD